MSAASRAWDAMLLKTHVKLDLITGLEVLAMPEKEQRGGLCFVGSKRYSKRNNKYLAGYDPNQPSNFSLYEDTNNLYAWAMMQLLPYEDLTFNKGHLTERDLEYTR